MRPASKLGILILAFALALAACGGERRSADDEGSSNNDSTSAGSVSDPQPPGQAKATIDGLEYVLTEPGGVDCVVEEDEFSFSFIIGDNEVVLGGGGFRNDGDEEWLATSDLRIANPDGEPGPISYFPVSDSFEIGIGRDSVSISGPMQKRPANDGSNPPPVDVGDGTFTFTCR